jgi:hypothetical protein
VLLLLSRQDRLHVGLPDRLRSEIDLQPIGGVIDADFAEDHHFRVLDPPSSAPRMAGYGDVQVCEHPLFRLRLHAEAIPDRRIGQPV